MTDYTVPALPPTGPFVDRIVRIFRDKPTDDTSAVVLQDYARAAELSRTMPAQSEPVAWRIRRGSSNIWGYCENESDADFLGGAGQMKYVKEPLYTHPPAQPMPAQGVQVTDAIVDAAQEETK